MITASQLMKEHVDDIAARAKISCIESGAKIKMMGIMAVDGYGLGEKSRYENVCQHSKLRFLKKISAKAKELPPIEVDFLTRSEIRDRYSLTRGGVRNMQYYGALPEPVYRDGKMGWLSVIVKEMEKRLINGEMK